MTEDRVWLLFCAVLGTVVVSAVAFVTIMCVRDINRLDDFRLRCENSGGIVLAQNGWDRVCVRGDLHPTERLDR